MFLEIKTRSMELITVVRCGRHILSFQHFSYDLASHISVPEKGLGPDFCFVKIIPNNLESIKNTIINCST